MSFVFDIHKSVQAAAYILKNAPKKKLTRGQLIKLLYLADRLSLQQRGYPITGDGPVAMNNGPVLTEIYDLIKGKSKKSKFQEIWTAFFTSERLDVVLRKDPGDGELSPSDIGILESVSKDFGYMTFSELRKYTHALDEFKKCHVSDTSKKIPLRILADAVGRKGDFQRIEQTKKFDVHMSRLFGN
ncbi:MAG TPA: Panacea domain-containing protein [Candidatus Hydrogenedentes bacterium]|nr:Panacea domain-containing protein [Candidatus Hydrogenedentota bacterium]